MLNRIVYTSFFLLSGVVFFTQTGKAQAPTTNIFTVLSQSTPGQGNIVLHQSEALKNLVNRYTEKRRKDGVLPGYRIRIFSESGNLARQHMYTEKTRFMELYPDWNVYFDSDQVYFKLYIGDFRNQAEAFRALNKISKDFRRAFIAKANINLPKL
jgi:hypothetical protein